MKVRGWLIIGPEEAARSLPTSAALVGPFHTPFPPDASNVEPGRWVLWSPAMNGAAVTLVCVEVPLTF